MAAPTPASVAAPLAAPRIPTLAATVAAGAQPTIPATGVTYSPDYQKAVANNVHQTQAALDSELSLVRWSIGGIAALVAITGVTAGGAAAFSNAAGVVTTVVAGGSGTAGLAGSLKSSLSFYANLKAQAKLKVDQMVADLGTARTDDDLEKVQKQVDDYYQWLATQSIPSK